MPRLDDDEGVELALKHLEGQDPQDHFVAYDGRSHKCLPWGIGELTHENWSTGAMNYDQVAELLGAMRRRPRG